MIIKTFKEKKLREPTNREILDELGDDANDNTINDARSTIAEDNVVINVNNE